MVRRTARWRKPKVHIDHHALFIEAAYRIERNSALLDAYRKSMALCIRVNRRAAAQESLALAAQHSADSCAWYDREWLPNSMQHAAKMALCAYGREWWIATPCYAMPADLVPGDEFYSWEKVRRIVESGFHEDPDWPQRVTSQPL